MQEEIHQQLLDIKPVRNCFEKTYNIFKIIGMV
jgi:hypothetical protein